MTKKSNRKRKRYARRGGRKQLIIPPPTHPQQEEETVVSLPSLLACTIPSSTICDGVEKLDCVQVTFDDAKLDCVDVACNDDDSGDLVRSSDTKENNQTDANSLTNSPVSTTSSSGHHTKLLNMSPIAATIPHVLAMTTPAPTRGLFPASVGVDLSDDIVQGHDSITIISVPPSSSGVSSSCDISPPPPPGNVVPAMSPFDDDGDGVSSTTPNLEPLPSSNKKKRQKRKRKRQQQQGVIVVNPPPNPLATKQYPSKTNDMRYKKGSHQGTYLGGHDEETQDSKQAPRTAAASLLVSNSTTIVVHVDNVNGNGVVVHMAENMMDVEEGLEDDREANGKSEAKPLDFREENGLWQLMAESDETEEKSKGVVKMEKTFVDEMEESKEEGEAEVEVKMETKTPFPSTFEELILMHFHRELNVAELVESMNCLEQDNKANEEHLAALMKQVSLLTSEKNELEKAFDD